MRNYKNNLEVDLVVIVISIVVAVILVKTGAIQNLLASFRGLEFIESFIAGLFFTSIFTTAPAIVALGEIAQMSQSVISVAIFGALGALCGDIIIFRFMRDRLGEDIMHLIKNSENGWLKHIIRLKFFRWGTFLLGALVISSPLPDELGLAMMGLSKTRTSLLIPVSFVFNFLGILVIGLVAKNLLGS